jgi:kumamolisin
MTELAVPPARRAHRRTPVRSSRRLGIVFAAALAAVATALGVGLGGAHGSSTSAGQPRVLQFAGRADAGSRIAFSLILRLPGHARLSSALHAIEDPASPRFRRLVGPHAFGSRFGLPTRRIDALARHLHAAGLRVIGGYPQRTELRVSGTVAAVQRLLSMRIGTWSDAHGHSYHAPLSRPQLPAAIRGEVTGVTGLDTRPRLIAHDVPVGGLGPAAAAAAYDIRTLHQQGFEGQGLSIAVISFSAFDPRDPAGFAKRFGITGPTPKVIPVDGGTTQFINPTEADLDIEVIRAIAPQAQILFYEAPMSTSAYGDAINKIVGDNRTKIISSSWGECERHLFGDQRAGDSAALTAAAAAGVSMFVASGDSGAYDCQASNFSDHRLTVDWPAASANTIAVGGTRLAVSANDSYLSETSWNDQLSGAGGGGGFSVGDPRPSWQAAPGVLSGNSTGRRQVPDVSADADPGTGWAVYADRQPGEVGGTSAAAPFWAASMLLIQQYAAAHGVGRLGFVDPILYALARSNAQPPPFHDVTRGTNRYYKAQPGWDPATGLGSPDVAHLAQDIVAYLRSHGG